MDLSDDIDLSAYFDTENGEILSIPNEIIVALEDGIDVSDSHPKWELDFYKIARRILSDVKNRFLAIPRRAPSRRSLLIAFPRRYDS